MKTIQLCLLVCFSLFLSTASAQCPASTPGALTNNPIPYFLPIDSIRPAPTFVTAPTGLPNTEFVISLLDSMAADSLGPAIVGVNADGVIDPQLYFLQPCQTIALTSFSYDLQQVKDVIHALLNDDFQTTPFPLSCCAAAGLAFAGICDTLNAYGIQDSSDVTSINDLLVLIGIVGGGGSVSVEGLVESLILLNQSVGQLGPCAGGVAELCYAIDYTNGSDFIRYTGLGTVATSIELSPDTATITLAGGTTSFTANAQPSNNDDVITWTLLNNNSGATIDANGQVTAGSSNDTLWVIAKATNGCDVSDTAVVVVALATSLDLQEAGASLQVQPNPFAEQLQLQYEGSGQDRLLLLDISGRVVWEKYNRQEGQYQEQVQTANLPAGMYILRLEHKTGVEQVKLIKY